MKLKTRLIIAFLTIILIPVMLSVVMIMIFGRYQIGAIEKTYGITGTTVESFSNPVQVLARLTEEPYHELKDMIRTEPEKMIDAAWLEEFNQRLLEKKSYLLVRRDDILVYIGTNSKLSRKVMEQLPEHEDSDFASENGMYLGGEAQSLVKQVDFLFPGGEKGSAFIVTDVSNVIPEVKEFFIDMQFGVILVLSLTACI